MNMLGCSIDMAELFSDSNEYEIMSLKPFCSLQLMTSRHTARHEQNVSGFILRSPTLMLCRYIMQC